MGGSDGVGGLNIAAVGFRAVLAQLELAFDACGGNTEADDASEQCAAEAFRQPAPVLGVGRFVCLDQAFEQGILAGLILDELQCSVRVDCDVIPGGNRKWLSVERRRYVAVWSGEDNEGFAIGEQRPV